MSRFAWPRFVFIARFRLATLTAVAALLVFGFNNDGWARGKRRAPNRSKKAPAHYKERDAASAPVRNQPSERTADAGSGSAQAAPPPSAPSRGRDVVSRESRIEFDERSIKGQTAAGAIYLFDRGSPDMKSMISVPGSFRKRTVATVLPATAEKRKDGR